MFKQMITIPIDQVPGSKIIVKEFPRICEMLALKPPRYQFPVNETRTELGNLITIQKTIESCDALPEQFRASIGPYLEAISQIIVAVYVGYQTGMPIGRRDLITLLKNANH